MFLSFWGVGAEQRKAMRSKRGERQEHIISWEFLTAVAGHHPEMKMDSAGYFQTSAAKQSRNRRAVCKTRRVGLQRLDHTSHNTQTRRTPEMLRLARGRWLATTFGAFVGLPGRPPLANVHFMSTERHPLIRSHPLTKTA
jgi:hypothetical protein